MPPLSHLLLPVTSQTRQDGDPNPPSSRRMNCWRAPCCVSLVSVSIVTVRSWMPSYAWKTTFHIIPSILWLLHSFSSLVHIKKGKAGVDGGWREEGSDRNKVTHCTQQPKSNTPNITRSTFYWLKEESEESVTGDHGREDCVWGLGTHHPCASDNTHSSFWSASLFYAFKLYADYGKWNVYWLKWTWDWREFNGSRSLVVKMFQIVNGFYELISSLTNTICVPYARFFCFRS